MPFPHPLTEGRLLRRYQRFLADVRLADGSVVTAHCPNTGSMLGCKSENARVWLSESADPRRRCRYTWELVETESGAMVAVNTARTNRFVRAAVEGGLIAELTGYPSIRPEVVYGEERSRVDFLLEDGNGRRCFVEVKNVTAVAGEAGEAAIFPDAVSARGARHLRELMRMAAAGHRAVIFFCVARRDVREMRPADAIDPAYGLALRKAMGAGVEALAYVWRITPDGVMVERRVPVVI